MSKKTFEISDIHSVEELNSLCVMLNEYEQVSHIKVSKESVVFNCIDIDALMGPIYLITKDFIIKEIIDGKKRGYDFVKSKEKRHYFMFKNMITEDDIYVLIKNLEEDSKYSEVNYDQKNKLLILTTAQRDTLSSVRKELFTINPSIHIVEHSRPIRSEDVFNQKYLKTYARIGIFLVVIALALITSKDKTFLTPVLWLATLLILSESLLKRMCKLIKQKKFLNEDVLIVCALIMTIVSGAYFEACIASVVYQLASPLLNRGLEDSLNKIDKSVEMPEKGIRLVDNKEEDISLYELKKGDIVVVYPGQTIHIPGSIINGPAQLNTYSNTSTYEIKKIRKGSHVSSGDINVGENPLHIQISKAYESTNFMNLMNIASVAPAYESKIEIYTKVLSRYYTPIMVILGLVLGVVLPIVNYRDYHTYVHVGAIFLVISGALSSSQSTSLGILAGFAKGFQSGIIVESSLGLDSINAAQSIIYDRFDGMEVTEEELALFKKLSHMGRTLVIFNDGPVALENDQYTIYNDLTLEEKLAKMDSLIGPIVYIGDSSKDIQLLQKSFVGISRGGLANAKVVENSDIVLLDANLNKVYETFLIARKMRSYAVLNSLFTLLMKVIIIVTVIVFTGLPLWLVILIEMVVSMIVMYNSTHILDKSR